MDRFHKTARILFGLFDADWDQLSAHCLRMKKKADKIASNAKFDPSKGLFGHMDDLEQRFPTNVAELGVLL